jgi:hypothetical protein
MPSRVFQGLSSERAENNNTFFFVTSCLRGCVLGLATKRPTTLNRDLGAIRFSDWAPIVH